LRFIQTLRSIPSRRAWSFGIGLWVIFGLIVGTLVAIHPDSRTVTPEYRQASVKWWHGKESPYNLTQSGYLYLPQEAIIYTPFQVLPKPLGEPLWRIACLTLLACGIWRVTRLFDEEHQGALFLLSTLLVIPASLSSARNGQINLPLAALMLLAVADLAKAHWNAATLWLLLGLMLKPVGIVPVLLAAACYVPLRLRLVGGFIVFLAAAYLHPDPSYVTAQYGYFYTTLMLAGQPTLTDFSDLFGMLLHWGIQPSLDFSIIVRGLAAIFTLGCSLFVMKAFRGRQTLQAFGVLFLSALYLMLFNPRTEENSYVILAGFTAILAARDFLGGATARGLVLAAFCILIAEENFSPILPLTKIWLKPLVTACLFTMLVLGGFRFLDLPPASRSPRDA